MQRFANLVAMLAANARDDRRITLIEGADEQRTLSFRRLQQRATGVLGALQRRGVCAGDAMLLVLGDNERFLEMFWACVLGGVVPVPLAAGAADEHRKKVLRVFDRFERAFIGTDARTLESLEAYAAAHDVGAAEANRLRAATLIAGTLDVAGPAGKPAPVSAETLAFIQFSSGSTGEPKGVRLTHGNLTANIASIAEAAHFSDRDVALSWMPLSHDMGLIGFHLNMLACGVDHAIMRTELFARRPLLWLEEASKRRATVLCSPNFGYQHYLRQLEAQRPARLDLSSVRLIFNGAEPISAALCRRFVAALAPYGLEPASLFPVYGLAEASLAVSFPRPGAPLETIVVDRTQLAVGEPVRVAAAGDRQAIELVKLGRAVPGTELRIAGADGTALDERRLGRVEVRGANLTSGYWNDAAATARVLSADGWLDTGDLGFLGEGQLVVAGRGKDVFFVNGQNVYPQDIEAIAERVDGIQLNRVAVAGVRRAGADSEELAVFIVRRGPVADFLAKASDVRKAVNRQTGLEVGYVVPVARIAKTTSGKLQRHALAEAFANGEFDAALAELAALAPAGAVSEGEGEATETVQRLLRICAQVVPDKALAPETNLMEINLSSLSLARIHEAIEREFPQRVDVTDLFDYPTLGQLAGFLDSKP